VSTTSNVCQLAMNASNRAVSAAAVTEAPRFQKVRRKWVTRRARDGKQQYVKRALVVGLGGG